MTPTRRRLRLVLAWCIYVPVNLFIVAVLAVGLFIDWASVVLRVDRCLDWADDVIRGRR